MQTCAKKTKKSAKWESLVWGSTPYSKFGGEPMDLVSCTWNKCSFQLRSTNTVLQKWISKHEDLDNSSFQNRWL